MATHAEVFESILAARGGRAAFSTEMLAIASSLAHASLRAANGDAAAAASIPALTALLPSRVVVAGEPDERLRRLTAVEVPVLEYLISRIEGEDEADPITEATWWHRCQRVERDLAFAEAKIAEFARANEVLHDQLKALQPSVPAFDEKVLTPAPTPTPPSDNVVALKKPATGWAVLAALNDGLGAPVPGISSGPEYQ